MTKKKLGIGLAVICIILIGILAGWLSSKPFCLDSGHVCEAEVNAYCAKCRGRNSVVAHECTNPNGKEIYCRLCGKIALGRFVSGRGQKTLDSTSAEVEDSARIEYEEDRILIINRWVNYAEGYEDEGFFIDGKGRVWLYCFTQWTYYPVVTDADFMQKLKDLQMYSEPVLTLEENVMNEVKKLCAGIDPTETYETKHMMYDGGNKILYVCHGDSMIRCRETMDFEGAMDSDSAIRFMKYFDDAVMPAITSCCEQMTQEEYEASQVYYYNQNELFFQNIHCGFCEQEGRYVVTNEEERAALEKMLGTDFGIGEWKNERGETYGECFIFFVEIINVSSGGYNLKRAGLMCQDGAFEMVPAKDSKVPEPGETVTEALDGFAFVATVPAEIAGLFVDRENGSYYDFYGGPWMRPVDMQKFADQN